MDANGIAEAVHAVVPNVIHQLLLAHGPPLMHHQVFKYPCFLAGERQRLPVDGGGTGAGVKGQQHILLGELPQGQAANASLQFGKMKGLCQIVVGSRVQSLHLVLHLTPGGEDQYFCLPVGLPQGAQHCHAVLPRQVQIQQYQIVALHAQKLHRLLPVVAAVHAVCLASQAADDGFAQGAFIFNY